MSHFKFYSATYSSDLTQDKSFIKQYKYNFIFVFKLELFCISL